MLLSSKTKILNNEQKKIDRLLKKGVEEIFVKESLEWKLKSGKALRVKFGIDPTGTQIHIGRAAVLRKLRAFQELGHQIILIIGDFTAQIGDPSDKISKRPRLSREQVNKNLEGYKDQIGKILDLNQTEFVYNSSWLEKLSFQEINELAESFSVSQMANRRNFKDRLSRGETVSLREFLYPLMQGYDSVAVKADVEIGGTDQLFNMMAGRVIQKHYGLPEQDVMTLKMLSGTDGRKMSTSWGNVVNISDSPEEMFGKIMSLHDTQIIHYFYLGTDLDDKEVEEIGALMAKGELNPKDAKKRLAAEIVKIYHGNKAAIAAEADFVKRFEKREAPANAPAVILKEKETLADVLIRSRLIVSKSEFQRLLSGGAIEEVGGGKIFDRNWRPKVSTVIRVGKHRFLAIKIER
jgi:tyrosyl-tRNA synthetase